MASDTGSFTSNENESEEDTDDNHRDAEIAKTSGTPCSKGDEASGERGEELEDKREEKSNEDEHKDKDDPLSSPRCKEQEQQSQISPRPEILGEAVAEAGTKEDGDVDFLAARTAGSRSSRDDISGGPTEADVGNDDDDEASSVVTEEDIVEEEDIPEDVSGATNEEGGYQDGGRKEGKNRGDDDGWDLEGNEKGESGSNPAVSGMAADRADGEQQQVVASSTTSEENGQLRSGARISDDLHKESGMQSKVDSVLEPGTSAHSAHSTNGTLSEESKDALSTTDGAICGDESAADGGKQANNGQPPPLSLPPGASVSVNDPSSPLALSPRTSALASSGAGSSMSSLSGLPLPPLGGARSRGGLQRALPPVAGKARSPLGAIGGREEAKMSASALAAATSLLSSDTSRRDGATTSTSPTELSPRDDGESVSAAQDTNKGKVAIAENHDGKLNPTVVSGRTNTEQDAVVGDEDKKKEEAQLRERLGLGDDGDDRGSSGDDGSSVKSTSSVHSPDDPARKRPEQDKESAETGMETSKETGVDSAREDKEHPQDGGGGLRDGVVDNEAEEVIEDLGEDGSSIDEDISFEQDSGTDGNSFDDDDYFS